MIMNLASMMILSIMISSNHPMILMIMLIFMSLIMSLNLFFLMSNQWFSIISMLIFTGGMMILFLFVISMTPNKTNSTLLSIILTILAFFTYKTYKNHFLISKYISNFMMYSWEIMILLMISFTLLLMITSMFILNPNKTMKMVN